MKLKNAKLCVNCEEIHDQVRAAFRAVSLDILPVGRYQATAQSSCIVNRDGRFGAPSLFDVRDVALLVCDQVCSLVPKITGRFTWAARSVSLFPFLLG